MGGTCVSRQRVANFILSWKFRVVMRLAPLLSVLRSMMRLTVFSSSSVMANVGLSAGWSESCVY